MCADLFKVNQHDHKPDLLDRENRKERKVQRGKPQGLLGLGFWLLNHVIINIKYKNKRGIHVRRKEDLKQREEFGVVKYNEISL